MAAKYVQNGVNAMKAGLKCNENETYLAHEGGNQNKYPLPAQ